MHVQHGFEFLGYKIKRGKQLKLSEDKIRSTARSGALYAYPRERSIRRFKDQVRALTKRRVPLSTKELIEELNPVLRGWGHYYKRVHVRKLFHRLDCWIVRRIWSHRCKRWRNRGWKQLPWAAPLQPVRACQLGRVNSFAGITPTVRLCESCIRQNRPCSLSGGRRPARKRASSDPTWIAGREGN